MNIAIFIKKIIRRFGYDIVAHRPLQKTILDRYNIKTIFDIGANDGTWSAEMRKLYPDAQIYAFEPLKECFSAIQKKFKNDNKCHIFNVALGDEDSLKFIDHNSFHPSSSILPMLPLHEELYPKSINRTKERIEVKKLDTLAPKLTLKKDILVKMDVQGYEEKVIAGGKNTLPNADIIIIETAYVHLYENQPLFGDIHNALEKIGFAYKGSATKHYSNKTGEPIYEDSIFVRKDS